MEKETKNMLDLLMQRAQQSESDKLKGFELKTEALGTVTVQVPPLKKIFSFMDDAKVAENTCEEMLIDAEVVYESIPELKSNYNALSDAYDEKDPRELVLKIFETANCIGEINDISDKVMSAAGVLKKTVKN